MLTLEEVLLNRGNKLVDNIVKAQEERGLTASGYSARNTRPIVTREGKVVVLEVIGPAYWRNQQYGRGPNRRKGRPSRAFIETIREWIKVKGVPIPLEAAPAIANKIVNQGIRVPNHHNRGGVLTVPINPETIAKDLRQLLPDYAGQQVRALLFD
jgi:hypothetical protein